MKRALLFLVKAAVGFGLFFYFVFRLTSPGQIAAVLGKISLPLALLAFSLHGIGLWISALRWRMLLQEKGSTHSVGELVASYLVGGFFNHFLPSRYGGDVIRVADTRHIEDGMTASLAVVVYERLSGILALVVFAVAASLLQFAFVRQFPFLYLTLGVSTLGILGLSFGWYLFPAGFFARFDRGGRARRFFFGKLDLFHRVMLDLLRKGRLGLRVFFWGLLLQLNVIVYYYLIGRALGVDRMPFGDYFFAIPLLLFILSIPATINGIGLRDAVMVRIFGYYGIAPSYAVSFALVDLLFNLLLGIIGGILYAARKP